MNTSLKIFALTLVTCLCSSLFGATSSANIAGPGPISFYRAINSYAQKNPDKEAFIQLLACLAPVLYEKIDGPTPPNPCLDLFLEAYAPETAAYQSLPPEKKRLYNYIALLTHDVE